MDCFINENRLSSVPPFDAITLLSSIENATLDTESLAALERVIQMKREEEERNAILENHKPPIKQRNDNRWYTRIGTEPKIRDRRQIIDSDKSVVEDAVIAFYQGTRTFKQVFDESEEAYLNSIQNPGKKKSAEGTKNSHEKTFRRFIKGTAFENMEIKKIGKPEMNELINHVLQTKGLKLQAFKNFRSVLNKTFIYALKHEMITVNPVDLILWDEFDDELFIPIGDVHKRGYTFEELSLMLDEDHKIQVAPESLYDSRPWAHEFAILTAGRRGEIAPLSWDDIDFAHKCIYFRKQLIGKYPYYIKDLLKKKKKIRIFPLTPELDEFFTRLKKHNDVYHPGSNYLFPNENEPLGCMSLGGTYKIHEKICKKYGIPISKELIKGTHAFRRVHETAFLNETGSTQWSEGIYGHNERTVKEFYLMQQNAQVTAPTVSNIQNAVIKGCTQLHTKEEEKEKPGTS